MNEGHEVLFFPRSSQEEKKERQTERSKEEC